ncbi:MAG: glycosyltransferase, partial [Clostridiales bacterium]|nr:glycosyltransferase [Clostridiales bacterium]
VYNVENQIERAIKSICHQTYNNLQIILINDGSTDQSLFKCYELAEIDNRIEVYSHENQGVAYTRNRGIELAKGKYLMFMDGDDWIEKDMLQTLYELAERYGADVANCILREESPEIAEQTDRNAIGEKNNCCITHFENKIDSGLALLTVWGPVCKLYRTDLIRNVRFKNYKVAEDLLFNTDVICTEKFSKVVTIYYPFYHYVIYPGSAMKQQFQQKYLDAMKVEEECYNRLIEISPKYGDINLIGCSVSRAFEKYAQLSKDEKGKHQAEFAACKKFAKEHKKALLHVSDRHRKISGILKVYLPDLYLWTLSIRYHKS